MENFSLLSCRMCLEIPSEESLTFSISDTFKGRNLGELIDQLFKIKISRNDFLTSVCVGCMNRINTVLSINQMFLQNNEKLQLLLEKFHEDSEEVEVLVIDEVNLLNEDTMREEADVEVKIIPVKPETEVSSTSVEEDFQVLKTEHEIQVEFINSQEHLEEESFEATEESLKNKLSSSQIKSDIQIPKHKCYFCQTVFETELAFTEHLHLHFEEVPLVCGKCNNLVIKSVRQASKHLALHDENERPHKCRICELRFFTRENSLTHERKIHRMKVKMKQTTDGYTERQKLKKFQCKICGLSVPNSQHLKKHILTHGPLPVHKCEVCSKEFTARKNLTRHLMIHTGEQPYKCDLCDRAFRQAGDLKDHTRSHTKEKPYICNVCGIRLRNISMLHVHRKKFHAPAT